MTRISVYHKKVDDNFGKAIICDIDGTLAHMGERSPYDYSQISSDSVDWIVREIVNLLLLEDWFNVILVTGRPETYRAETMKWLQENGVNYHKLYMRPEGDKREDTTIKREIYEQHIGPYYEVMAVFEDRSRVVKMWRDLGLKVLQVDEGDF